MPQSDDDAVRALAREMREHLNRAMTIGERITDMIGQVDASPCPVYRLPCLPPGRVTRMRAALFYAAVVAGVSAGILLAGWLRMMALALGTHQWDLY